MQPESNQKKAQQQSVKKNEMLWVNSNEKDEKDNKLKQQQQQQPFDDEGGWALLWNAESMTEESTTSTTGSPPTSAAASSSSSTLHPLLMRRTSSLSESVMMAVAANEEGASSSSSSSSSPINGMRSLPSCYFSVHSASCSEASSQSVADLLSLWEETAAMTTTTTTTSTAACSSLLHVEDPSSSSSSSSSSVEASYNASNSSSSSPSCSLWHHHDVLMHVMSYLDVESLAALSETARRPNFECFYFLQLQLQQALHSTDNNHHTCIPSTPGAGYLTRLAGMDFPAAKDIVESFLDSNSTLRRTLQRNRAMSSHVAFLKHVMRVAINMTDLHIHQQQPPQQNNHTAPPPTTHTDSGINLTTPAAPAKGMASTAAFWITLLGMASLMTTTTTTTTVGAMEAALMEFAKAWMTTESYYISSSTQFVLMQLGLLSLMGAGAARTTTTTKHATQPPPPPSQQDRADTTATNHHADKDSHPSMTERAEQLCRRMLNEFIHEFHAFVADQTNGNHDHHVGTPPVGQSHPSHLNQNDENNQSAEATPGGKWMAPRAPQEQDFLWTSNPYEHLPEESMTAQQQQESGADMDEEDSPNRDSSTSSASGTSESHSPPRKMASGCVGAYCRAISTARSNLKQILRRQRKSNFQALSTQEQQEISTAFIDACCNDDSLETIRGLVVTRKLIDVEGFYVGSDGTETCALHAAAFHGAEKVLEFLCQDVDETDDSCDGGLCDVDLRDANGWTAAHFAAGANGVDAMRILSAHGAILSVEAVNGYTPLQWALRLQNEQVATVLRQELLAQHGGVDGDDFDYSSWILNTAQQPLAALANRLLALIPPTSRG